MATFCVWAFSPQKHAHTVHIEPNAQARLYGGVAIVADKRGYELTYKSKAEAKAACEQLIGKAGLTYRADKYVQ